MKPSISLIALLNEIDPTTIKSPTEPIGRDETKVGTLSDHTKRLYGLYSKNYDYCASLVPKLLELQAEHDKLVAGSASRSDIAQHLAGINRLADEIMPHVEARNSLKKILWSTIRFEFPELQGKEEIIIREGFSVVWKEADGPFFRVVSLGNLSELFQ